MQHLQQNTTLQGGKYRIERVLGQGGFGITYLARNTVFDVDVAIKEFFMKDENSRDGSSVTMPNTTKQELFHGQMEKFKKEAKRMFAIKNEHVIGVQDLFEENGTDYYVMDYVDGENLAERLKRTGKPMSEQEVYTILPQILDALKSVHDAGIWHLDLKPANIMLDKAGNVKLIDFGASKQLNVQKGGATTSTAISYTNGYAPREQMEQNYEKFGPWTDIYALGATLFTLLTNKRPPLPTDIDDDASEEKHKALPMSENISKEMKSLILWMMQTDRNQRPQIIKEVTSYLTVPVDVDEETITINRNNGVFSYESDKRFYYCIKYFIRRNEWLKPVSILVTIIASILLACFILIPLELEYSKLPYKSMIALLIFIPFSIQPIIDKAEDKFFWKYFGVWVAYLSTIILLFYLIIKYTN
jgi:serine/threonine-protein kinase